jgi:hypothetical protein
MLRAYVGLVDRRGLRVFLPENESSLTLIRRLSQRWAVAGCCWAVVAQEVSERIELFLEDGEWGVAWRVLCAGATEAGPILPAASHSRFRVSSA